MGRSRQDTTADVIDCAKPAEREAGVQRGAELLRGGGLVVFPTETVYGVGAAVTSPAAMQRLRAVKDRSDTKPFTLHLPGVDHVGRYVDLDANARLRRLVRRTMPGPITIVAEVDAEFAEARLAEHGLPASAKNELYHQNTIGLRCPDDPVAEQLLRRAEVAVAASSANPAGQPPPNEAASAARLIGDAVDLVLDGGRCRYAQPSTVVRVRGSSIELLREGVYDRRYIEKLMQRSILFVCSGNTCRSPMAEAIARHELAVRLNVSPDQLETAEWSVASAGAFAASGSPMSDEAVKALEQLKIPAKPHRSRALSAEMVRGAEVVYCMTDAHREAVLAVAPDAVEKVHRLDPAGDIEDPMGGSVSVYFSTAKRLQDQIGRRLDELAP